MQPPGRSDRYARAATFLRRSRWNALPMVTRPADPASTSSSSALRVTQVMFSTPHWRAFARPKATASSYWSTAQTSVKTDIRRHAGGQERLLGA